MPDSEKIYTITLTTPLAEHLVLPIARDLGFIVEFDPETGEEPSEAEQIPLAVEFLTNLGKNIIKDMVKPTILRLNIQAVGDVIQQAEQAKQQAEASTETLLEQSITGVVDEQAIN